MPDSKWTLITKGIGDGAMEVYERAEIIEGVAYRWHLDRALVEGVEIDERERLMDARWDAFMRNLGIAA